MNIISDHYFLLSLKQSAFFDMIGGIDPKETVKRSLLKTFSNKLATEFL